MQARTIIGVGKLLVRGCQLLAVILPNFAQAGQVPGSVDQPGFYSLREKQKPNIVSSDEPFPPLVSLIALIANPKMFDQREIDVLGYLIVESDHNALYFSEADAKNKITPNSFWIDDVRICIRSRVNRSYVIVRGVFVAYPGGPGDLFSSRMNRVTRCDAWR